MARRTVWVWGRCCVRWLPGAAAADATAGKALHDASCLKCHGVDVCSSSQRKIKSLDVLGTLIATWCIAHRVALLHNDRDFHPFVPLGLVEA